MHSYTIFFILRSFRTGKFEHFQLHPTSDFRLATPMVRDMNFSAAIQDYGNNFDMAIKLGCRGGEGMTQIFMSIRDFSVP